MSEITQRRGTFDREANQYERIRPGYPEELFEDVIKLSRIPANGDILEIGCGTGQATLPFARRGYSIHCIELGENLAAIAKKNLAQYPNARVSTGSFEEFSLQEDSYDLVISATAFHWVDPEIGYPKVAKILKPKGTIALFWNKPVQTELSAGFFESIQSVYMQVVPSMAKEFPGLPHPDEIKLPIKAEIEQTGQFGDVTTRKYKWDREYFAQEYVNLLNTYSDHLSLDDDTRIRLLKRIKNHIDTEFGGRIVKEHLAILYLAKRKED
jgi:SAM-dependent methyltransferase